MALYFVFSSNYQENTCKVHVFDKERFINMSDFENKEDMTLNSLFLDNGFTYQILVKIKNQSIETKSELLFECIENSEALILTDGTFLHFDCEAIRVVVAMSEVLSHHHVPITDAFGLVEIFKEAKTTQAAYDYLSDHLDELAAEKHVEILRMTQTEVE